MESATMSSALILDGRTDGVLKAVRTVRNKKRLCGISQRFFRPFLVCTCQYWQPSVVPVAGCHMLILVGDSSIRKDSRWLNTISCGKPVLTTCLLFTTVPVRPMTLTVQLDVISCKKCWVLNVKFHSNTLYCFPALNTRDHGLTTNLLILYPRYFCTLEGSAEFNHLITSTNSEIQILVKWCLSLILVSLKNGNVYKSTYHSHHQHQLSLHVNGNQ